MLRPLSLPSWLELEPRQKTRFCAWLVENKGDPKKYKKGKRGANSGEAMSQDCLMVYA